MRLLTGWFTHLAAFNVSGLIETHFSPPDVSSLPSHSLHLHLSSKITNGTAELTFSLVFFHSLFYCFPSIISHSCFPSVLAFLPCIWSRSWEPIRVMQTHALQVFFFFYHFSFFPSFVFVLRLHPALALLKPLSHYATPTIWCHFILLRSLPENFTLLLLFSKKLLRLLLRESCYCQPVERTKKRGEEWGEES